MTVGAIIELLQNSGFEVRIVNHPVTGVAKMYARRWEPLPNLDELMTWDKDGLDEMIQHTGFLSWITRNLR